MKEYQPTNSNLLNFAAELLENNTINGIQCFLNDENTFMIVEMQIGEEVKKVGARIVYPLDDLKKQLNHLEENLLENIKVYFLVESIELKARKFVNNIAHFPEIK